MNKVTKLGLLLGGLILISVVIAFSGEKGNSRSFDESRFTIADTAAIQSISISKGNSTNMLTRSQYGWRINDRYAADRDMTQVLKTILAQVTVKRPVAKMNQEEIIQELATTGRQIEVTLVNNEKISFTSGGNASKTDSYFYQDGTVYIVSIPGYNNYVSGIFEIPENQWRDRLLFSSSWRSIQTLELDYLGKKPKTRVFFDEKFLAVEGIQSLDTVALMNYLGQYEYFQLNDYLARGIYPRYDSLAETNPLALLSMKDINEARSVNLKVYPLLTNEKFYLLKNEEDEMMVIDSKRMEGLLVDREKFISK